MLKLQPTSTCRRFGELFRFAFVLAFVVGAPNVARTEELGRLLKLLADPQHRQGASLALARQGGTAEDGLLTLLRTGGRDERVWAAYTLGKIDEPSDSAVQVLCETTRDSDASLRAIVAQALGRIRNPIAVESVQPLLDDEQVAVRINAAVALGQFGPHAAKASGKLIPLLVHPNTRTVARESLLKIGPAAHEPLAAALANDAWRFDVAWVLRSGNSELIKELNLVEATIVDLPSCRAALADDTRSLDSRAFAAAQLAQLGEDGIRVLVDGLQTPDIASIAIAALPQGSEVARPMVVVFAKDQRPEVRAAAADALARLGVGESTLNQLLQDKDRNVRYRAVRALHELGPKAAPAVPALSNTILDPSESELTRQWALKTLVMTLPKTRAAVVKTMKEASQEDKNYGVKQLAIQLLKNIDKE